MLTTNKKILEKANKGKYAVGAFNVNNLEFLQAVVSAAEAKKSPAIIQTTEGAVKYAGLDNLICLVKTAANKVKIPLSLHLDHGKNLKLIKRCIDSGYTSVMFDGSHLFFEKNVFLTKKVVSMAHKKGVSVEAELGTIGGVEDKVSARKITYTDPDKAVEFVKRTRIDALAVAIGTSHGAYKFKGDAKLNYGILKEIKKRVNIPLVLHGASGIPKKIIAMDVKYGAKFGMVKGVSDAAIKKAVKLGVNKINIDSDIRLAFLGGVRRYLAKNPKEFDPRKYLAAGRAIVNSLVRHKIEVFGSRRKS